MSAIRKMNPWKDGELNESLAKLQKLVVKSQATLRDVLDTLGRIEKSLAGIEREDQSRRAIHEAAAKLRNE
jgi:hypothetical protein